MTPETALAAALNAEGFQATAEDAAAIIAALPRGWRLTDDQVSADAFRRGWAEGFATAQEKALTEGVS
jgi:flagellar biosynthesis/type III secretory pathway protein FliH